MKSADRAIALGIGFEMAAQGGPGAEVVPGEGAIGHDDVVRVLHEGVINRDSLELGIFLGEDLDELGRGARRL